MAIEEQLVMMSETLVNNISDEILIEHENKFVLSVFSFCVEERTEDVLGSVREHAVDENGIEMRILVGLDDAFAMNMTWPKLKLVSYKLKLGNEICHFDGPFEVTKIGWGNMDHDSRNCVLLMKLRKI
jgi:hypothetical protein